MIKCTIDNVLMNISPLRGYIFVDAFFYKHFVPNGTIFLNSVRSGMFIEHSNNRNFKLRRSEI